MVKNTLGMDFFTQFKHHPHVSISKRQQQEMPGINYVATVYNSIVMKNFQFNETGGNDMIWLGRVTKNKGLEAAIKARDTLHKPLTIAGVVDNADKEFYEAEIQPHFEEPLHEVKTAAAKSTFFGNGKLLLYPLQWEEPFGLVMAEAMACGTPVVAYARGSVPEIVKDGETGFLVNPSDTDIRGNYVVKKTGFEGICEAIERMYSLSEENYRAMRKASRKHVEKSFSVEKMVDDYIKVYEKILSV
jgi:glycosyltransferase involved in cell wall biosynthesis